MKKLLLYIFLIMLAIVYIIIYIFDYQTIGYLVIGGNTYIKYTKNNLKVEKNININPKLNYKKYKIYDGEKFIDGYLKFYNDDYLGDVIYTLYNNSIDEEKIYNSLLAYTGNINIDVADTIITDKISDNDKNILRSKLNGITSNLEDMEFKKITVDINNDNQKEYIYYVYKYDTEINKIYNSIFMIDSNNNIIDIVGNDVSTGEDYKFNVYDINYVADVDMDGEYEVILSSFYEESLTNYEIYKLKNSKFEKLG